MNAPLDGIRVIDATTRWGELAGRVLAELGAQVFKVEPPGGCESRRLGPFAESARDERPLGEGESLYWACVGAGKESIVADDVEPLLADADVFIESGRHGDFSAAHPHLVHVSVTPFGCTGPMAAMPAAEVTVEAAGGLVGLQGDGDRAPLPMGAMPQAAFHAGVQAAADILVALYERDQSGLGQHLDVSAQACVVWTLMNATGYPPNTGRNPPFSSEYRGQVPQASTEAPRLRLPGLVSCRDGLIQVRFQMRVIGERTFDALLRWVEASNGDVPESVRGLDLNAWMAALRDGELDLEAAQTAADLIVELLATRTKQEIQQFSANHGLTLAAIHTVPDLLCDPHLADRGFWVETDHDGGGSGLIHAGPFARMSGTPLRLDRDAPALGSSPPPPPRRPTAGVRRSKDAPFAGLKVADFSWVGVGPMIGKALADHGATVVRIESASRVDLLRTVPPFKDGEPGVDRAQFMANFNTSKLGMTVDLKNPQGRRLARRMADWADVVLESYSPGTMGRFGLDWDTLSADRDDLVMLSTSIRGQTGRERGYSGYGGQGACISGLYELVGWPDRDPCGPWGAYTDFITPRYGVCAVVAALMHRRRTGLGQHIDLAQVECGIRFLEPLILDYVVNGHVAARLGQGSPSLDPHGVFACAGEQRYLAIGVETEPERHALAGVIGEASLADWCLDREAFHAADILRNAGVPAYVVMRPSDLYEDPQLEHRGFFVTLDHSVMGPTPYDGPATIYSRTPQRLRSAAPCLGQHNDQVLRECLGFEDQEIERLREAGALG
ncbi:MAG: CoA transferase [Gammaproteobacteria bacterium]|nr:CoA transferase [Gammaproteobacteria bacterium]